MRSKGSMLNRTMIQTKDGMEILFSYSTPVAIRQPDGKSFVTRNTSRTSRKHIAALCWSNAEIVDQEWLDQVVESL